MASPPDLADCARLFLVFAWQPEKIRTIQKQKKTQCMKTTLCPNVNL